MVLTEIPGDREACAVFSFEGFAMFCLRALTLSHTHTYNISMTTYLSGDRGCCVCILVCSVWSWKKGKTRCVEEAFINPCSLSIIHELLIGDRWASVLIVND